jgi:predicted RNA-binding protein with PUA-like domain
MPNRWLMKTEPSTYAFADLLREGRTTWDGVSSPAALIHLRAMRKGEEVLIYHSGDERAVVGLARLASDPYPDPGLGDPRRVVVDLVPLRALARPVPLSTIKADRRFADLALVRISRLSVMPVAGAQWDRLLELGGRASGRP